MTTTTLQTANNDLTGWQSIETYADGSTLDILFEGGLPVRVCVDGEDALSHKDIQDSIQNSLGIWVHLGEWDAAENGLVVASVSVDEAQGV